MMRHGDQPMRRGLRAIGVLGGLVLIGVIVLVRCETRCNGEGFRAGVSSEKKATTQPTTATAPVKKVEKWSPPRFTARVRERERMADTIHRYGLKDKGILKAMTEVPRHEFVPKKLQRYSYSDSPLPIGSGQTISQPYMVAEMTRQLKLTGDSRVLEIGTGSGYQAAVLSEFTPHVYTIEIVKDLATNAEKRLKRLGYKVVQVRWSDGYYGWEEKGPFDAIIVTCAAGQIPPPLVKQLAPQGRMVIPVGPPGSTQTLILVEKDKKGRLRSKSLMAVRFVPLTRRKDRSK